MDVHYFFRDLLALYVTVSLIAAVAQDTVPGAKLFVAAIILMLDTIYFILVETGTIQRYV